MSLLRRRTPKTAAVAIDSPSEGSTLASAMRRVAEEVNLQHLGVKVNTTKRTKTVGILLEVGTIEDAIGLQKK